jgi:hypothetical protein
VFPWLKCCAWVSARAKTNLTLDEPAKKRELKFKRKDFEYNFEEIFPKGMKKKKRSL